MTEETIVLHNHQLFSIKTTRIITASLGVLLIFLDINLMIRTGRFGFASNLFWGLFLLFTSIFVLSKNSVLSPKIKFTKTGITVKKEFWSRSKTMKWLEISSIEFGSYKILFQLQESTYKFTYNTSADLSVQIKQAIRTAANQKSIPVS